MNGDDLIGQPRSNVKKDAHGADVLGSELAAAAVADTPGADRPRIAYLAVFGLAYVLAGGFGQGLPLIPGVAITFWPPAGIFLAALLLNPRSHWAWYVAIACLAELACNQIWFHNPLPFALIYFVANALEVSFAAWLLGRFASRPFALEEPRDVGAFVVIAAGLAPIVGATIIATTDAIIGKHDFATAWPLVWLGDGTGMLFSTPIALAVGQAWRDRETVPPLRLLEAGILAVLLVVVGALAFAHRLPTDYVTMPLVMWAAVRFQLRGAAVALALLAITAAFITRMQAGGSGAPTDGPLAEVVVLQTFLWVTAVSALLTAGLSHLHTRAQTELQAAKRDLEHRVVERTELLGRERARLAIALRTGLMGVHEWRLRDRAMWWSPEVYPLYGVDPATFTPTSDAVLGLVHPDDREDLLRKTEVSRGPGELSVMEFRIVRPDGQVRWLQNRSHVELAANGLAERITGVVADITERKEAGAALRENEARLRGILQQSPAGIVQTDAEGRMTLVNPRWYEMLGYPEAELLGRKLIDVIHPSSMAATVNAITGLAAGGPDFLIEMHYQRKDGSMFSAQSNVTAMRAPSGEYLGLIAVVLDISERLRTEAALREKEHFLKRVTEVTPGVLHVFDLVENRSVFINKSAASLLGYSPEEMIAMGSEAAPTLMHPDDLARFPQHLARVRALDDGEVADFEHRMRDSAGEWHWFHSHDAVFTRDEAGSARQLIGLASEITARKQAEAALREREERLRLILDGAVAFIGVMDPDGTLIEANAAALAAGGVTRAEVLDRKLWETVWFGHDEAVARHIQDAVRRACKGEIVREDVVVRMRGDTRMTIDFKLAPVRDDEGNVRLLIPSGFDITERKRAETALRLSHDTYLNLIETNPFGVYLVDSSFRMAQISAGAKKVFDNVDPLIGRNFEDILRTVWLEPFASEAAARFRHTLQTGEAYHSRETTERRSDLDTEESYDWQIERVTLPDGEFGVVCYFYDMTERKRQEQQIHYLMGEVNHRAKNLLAVVQAIAAQTARAGDPATFTARLSERIQGLAAAHDLLVRNQWVGAGVADLVRAQLSHFADLFDTRVQFGGPPLRLRPSAAQAIGMALHEMATNAAKYGALSNDEGRIRITWGKVVGNEPSFFMQWIEEGGPRVTPPMHEGFGNRVIKRMAEAAVDGTVKIEYKESGFVWQLSAPIGNLTED
jgi:PAS domain S-box-containing protein